MEFSFTDDYEKLQTVRVWFVDGRGDTPVFILHEFTSTILCRCLNRNRNGNFSLTPITYPVSHDRLHPEPSLGELLSV